MKTLGSGTSHIIGRKYKQYGKLYSLVVRMFPYEAGVSWFDKFDLYKFIKNFTEKINKSFGNLKLETEQPWNFTKHACSYMKLGNFI